MTTKAVHNVFKANLLTLHPTTFCHITRSLATVAIYQFFFSFLLSIKFPYSLCHLLCPLPLQDFSLPTMLR